METVAQIHFTQSGEQLKIQFPTGDTLYTEDLLLWDNVSMYLTITYMGQYFYHHAPQRGEVVFDVGANVGAFALAAARLVGPTGHVYCLEPVPGNQAVLAKNIEANALTNVTVIPRAVGDKCGELALHLGSVGTMHSGIFDFGKGDRTVPVTTLDALTEELGLPRVDFVKIDVEGMEAQVLRSATETLRRHKPFIVAASYHTPQDITVLPQIIKEAEPSYVVECGGQPHWAEPAICARCIPARQTANDALADRSAGKRDF
jgi:FkbM family methyltransferase